MESVSLAQLMKMFLILFLGVQDAPQGAGRGPAIEALAPSGAIGYVALDVAQARALVQADAETARALLDERTPQVACGEAAAVISQRMGMEPAALREAAGKVSAIGVWVMGVQRHVRFAAVLDRGDAADILPRLFVAGAPSGKPDALRTVGYAGRTLYGVGRRASESVWFGEVNGFLVLASDLLAAESMVLKLRASAPAPAVGARVPPPILYARVDAGMLVNGVLSGMDRHAMEELTAAGAFFDLPAWRQLTLRVGRESAILRADLDPDSPLAPALKPAEQLPSLLDAIPAGEPLAAAVGVEDATRIWKLLEVGFQYAAAERLGPSPREEFLRDFQRSAGLDLQAEVVSNLVGAAYVGSDPGNLFRADRGGGAVYFAGRDAARTLATARSLVAKAARGKDTVAEDRAGAQVWRVDDVVIAAKGNLLLVAPSREAAAPATERLLRHLLEGGESQRKHLAARLTGATAVVALDAARCLPRAGLGRITADATRDNTGLSLRVEDDGRKLAAGLLRLLGNVGRGADGQTAMKQTMYSLRQLYSACEVYAAEQGKRPAEMQDLKPYLAKPEAVWRDPRTGELFRLNPAVAGKAPGAIRNPAATILIYAPAGGSASTALAAFCDGHVQPLTDAELRAALNPPEPKP